MRGLYLLLLAAFLQQTVYAQCGTVSGFWVTYTGGQAANAVMHWNKPVTGNTPTAYQWEVRYSGLPGTAGGTYKRGTSTDTFSIAYTLTSQTAYTFYVRTICGAGVYGNWVDYVVSHCLNQVPYQVIIDSTFPGPCARNYVTQYDIRGITWSSNSANHSIRYCGGADPGDAVFESAPIFFKKDTSYTISYDWSGNADNYYAVTFFGKVPTWGSGTNSREYTPSVDVAQGISFHAETFPSGGGCFSAKNINIKKTTCGVITSTSLSRITINKATLVWQSPTIGNSFNYRGYIAAFTYIHSGSAI